ncbi:MULTISPECIES: hypothetical protein [unclassified Achromobacter]|uniref:hypothetical protein n=1 Tax=unclassified Achromobacter TaxID=2626865 RepID=UPI000B51A8E0|nr:MULTISPECIES: hypothetical protein [unclassified Achromobacter]OWT77033.1 hypothetical protein CEY04_13625 [Achromobacter sp. HZ28]OWT77914.1 hypothetical protein CEY05_08120 [Achromobacter sp. HZ34]
MDTQGEALVRRYSVEDYTDAEDWHYEVMPAEQAYALRESYRQARRHAPTLENQTEPTSVWVLPAIIAIDGPETGERYHGPLNGIQGGKASQEVSDGFYVAHPANALAVDDPQRFVGKTIDIHYPCGIVGLLREAALEAAPTQLDHPEKTHGGPTYERCRRARAPPGMPGPDACVDKAGISRPMRRSTRRSQQETRK